MAYQPQTNSVVAFQSDPTKLVGTVSVVSHSPQSVAALQGTNPWVVGNSSVQVVGVMPTQSVMAIPGIGVLGSVATLQGTNPWHVQLTSGSIVTIGGNSSVQVVGEMPPQSVSGVGLFNINPTGGGSIIAKLTNSSVTAYQGVTPWVVQTVGSVLTQYREDVVATSVIGYPLVFRRTDSASLMGIVSPANPLPVQGSVTALQGTQPWLTQIVTSVATRATPASVQLIGGTNVIGSVAVLQGTNPWVIGNSSVQVQNIATGNSSVQLISTSASIATQVNRILQGVSSVQVMTGIGVIGSVAALQGTQPWLTQVVTSVATRPGPGSVSGVGIFNVNHTGNGSVLVVVPGSVATVFSPASPISGHASTVNASSGSVLVLASVQATLYAYVTDFLLSNTGATTTLVKFTDRDGSVMGKSIAPTGGGAVATAITSPMKTLVAGSPVYMGADTATSTLHGWVGGYKGL